MISSALFKGHSFSRLRVIFLLMTGVILIITAGQAFAQDRKGPRMTYVYDGPPVSFAQLYENPDDRELNLSYARQQSARGDLLGASAALERLLYAEPNWHSARLFYAAVLYRLDDKKAALSELELLSGSDMTDQQRALYEDYGFAFQYTPAQTAVSDLTPEQIAYARERDADVLPDTSEPSLAAVKPSKSQTSALYNGRISAGVRADSNAGNALTDVAVGLTDQEDVSAFLTAGVQGQVPIGESGVQAFGGLNGQIRRHDSFDNADFSTIGGHAGIFKDAGSLRVSAQVDVDSISVSGDRYLMQAGPRLTLSTHNTPDLRIAVSAAHYNQDYENLTFASNDSAASGDKTVALLRITKKLNTKFALGGSFGIERKSADANSLSYDAVRLSAQFRAGEEAGLQVRGRVTRRDLSFKETGLDLNRINARIGVSAPINTLIKSDALPDVRVEAAINYNERNYDAPGDDFKNTGAELRLIWDF